MSWAKKPGPAGWIEARREGQPLGNRAWRRVIIAPDGTHLGTLSTGVPTANVAWGDDGSTLYITANTAVFRVKTRTTGKPCRN